MIDCADVESLHAVAVGVVLAREGLLDTDNRRGSCFAVGVKAPVSVGGLKMKPGTGPEGFLSCTVPDGPCVLRTVSSRNAFKERYTNSELVICGTAGSSFSISTS